MASIKFSNIFRMSYIRFLSRFVNLSQTYLSHHLELFSRSSECPSNKARSCNIFLLHSYLHSPLTFKNIRTTVHFLTVFYPAKYVWKPRVRSLIFGELNAIATKFRNTLLLFSLPKSIDS